MINDPLGFNPVKEEDIALENQHTLVSEFIPRSMSKEELDTVFGQTSEMSVSVYKMLLSHYGLEETEEQ